MCNCGQRLPMQSDKVSAPPKSVQSKQALPMLPAASRFETIDTLKAAIPARAALATFAQALKQSSISDTATSAFSVLESVGALQMQGEALELSASLSAGDDCHTSDILHRHILARRYAHTHLTSEPVGSLLALDLAAALHGKPTAIRRSAAPDKSCSIVDENFLNLTPPTGAERLQALLENWHSFIQRDSGDLDPLIMAAAANGQWMALRPFSHQNIAVGQLLTLLLLCEEDLLCAPALPLSLYLSRRSNRHWQFLYHAVAFGDHLAWLRFFMTAVTEACIDATDQLLQWERKNVSMKEAMHELLPKPPSDALLEVCYKPSFGLADLSDCGLARRQTATAWMQRLLDAGLLSEVRIGKHKRYINKDVMSLLTA